MTTNGTGTSQVRPLGGPLTVRTVEATGTPLDLRAWARAYVRAILDAEGITLDALDQRDAA